MTLIDDVFREIPVPKNMVRKMSKSCVFEDLYTDNMANGLKHRCNLNGSTFTIFIKHFEGRYVGKSLF